MRSLTSVATLLEAANLLAAMVWVGGLVAVAVAVAAARAALGPNEQIDFFRALGRRYGLVSGAALVVFATTGLALAGEPAGWTAREEAIAVLVMAVAALTVAGVRAARYTQELNAEALARPSDEQAAERLRRARRHSGGLRILIAAASLATVLVATL